MSTHERFAHWLAIHPRWRWTFNIMITTYVLCGWALISAPSAAAATGGAALGWTGLHDVDGVALKDMFLSVVDTTEAMTNNGQEVTWDPTTWMKWLGEVVQTTASHSTVTWLLTLEASTIVFGAGISFYFLRFAMSHAYLLALAEVARPVFAAVNVLVNQLWLGPIALVLCVSVAGFHYQMGRPGRAWAVAGNGAILFVLLLTVFRHPIDELTSEHGLLGIARGTGFQIVQTARGGSYAPGRGLDDQLDALMAQLISNTVRPMLQLMNFGRVIDNTPGCRQAWNRAITAANGQGPGPAHAMSPDPRIGDPTGVRCSAADALAHAQHLGSNDFILGVLFLAVGFFIGLFIWYVGISTLLVGAKATYYAIVVGPAFLLGMTGWQRAKNFATRAGTQVFFHAAETIIFTAFLGISVVGMGWALTTRVMGAGDMTVVPRLLLVMVGSIVALFLFHYIDKHFYTDNAGTIVHHWNSIWHAGRDHARSEYDDLQDGLDQMRNARDRVRSWRGGGQESAAGEEDAAANDVPGFDVVKPRPSRRLIDEATEKVTGATAAPSGSATEVATTATRSGTAIAEAETAAEAVAPEVAVPAAAAVSAVQHARKHHHDKQQPQQQSFDYDSTDNTNWAPTGADTSWSPIQDNSAEPPLTISPVGQRPTNRSGRHAAEPSADPASAPTGADASLDDPSAPGPGQQDDPPLELPASAPRPSVRKGERS